jgi:hypothetical protein
MCGAGPQVPPIARRLVELASDPPASGGIRIYRNTLTGKVRASDGSTWSDVGGTTTKVYRAILNQSGTSVPVATILENSLGGVPTFTRSGSGVYRMTLTNAFTANKTFITPNSFTADTGDVISIVQLSVSVIQIGSGADDTLNNLMLEILVYP